MVIALASAAQTQQKPNPEAVPAPQPSQAPSAETPQSPGTAQGAQQAPAPQAPETPQAQDAPGQGSQAQGSQPQGSQTQEAQPEAAGYDKAIFQNPLPADQVAFVRRFEGTAASDVLRDKQFHKFMQRMIPDCMFHYGRDMALLDAMEIVLQGSPEPARISDGRYFLVSGRSGPYLQGRGFMWVDLQDGIVLGGFYFHPTNGEPTPAVNVFSRQVKEQYLALSQLPPAFAEDLDQWSRDYRVPPVTTRYFITGSNRKILLEHDEDYCAQSGASANDCQEMNSDAADLDMNAANYLEQTHHVTNATAWMITGEDQRVWLDVRARTCIGPDLLPCRIRLTRERVRVIIGRPVRPVRPHHVPIPPRPTVSRSK
jgi:hypothetical protein